MKLVVDFGKNDKVNRSVGAGDILPDEVTHVKINGTEGYEKSLDPRPDSTTSRGNTSHLRRIYHRSAFLKELSEADTAHRSICIPAVSKKSFPTTLPILCAEIMTAQHMLVKADTPKEAEALANVLSATLGISDKPEQVAKLKADLLGAGVDLGKEGPYAAKNPRISRTNRQDVPRSRW